MEPRIEMLPETNLIGQKVSMSFSDNKTGELWRSFAPRRDDIKNPVGTNSYSVEIYPGTDFFNEFDPFTVFEKWAAVAVSGFNEVPDDMETLTIPSGLYAVFAYKGKPSEAQETFRFIYGTWLPQSGYIMDDRPYFALMGEKYLGEDPDSEEEFWIPIRKK